MSLSTELLVLLLLCISVTDANIQQKTKLCLNEYCSDALFSAKIIRKYDSNHESILSYAEGDQVDIFSFRYSDRADFLGAKLNDKSGAIFKSHVDLAVYVEFLESALKENKTFLKVVQDNNAAPNKRITGSVAAIPELVKEYEVHAKKLALENAEAARPLLDLEALGYNEAAQAHEQKVEAPKINPIDVQNVPEVTTSTPIVQSEQTTIAPPPTPTAAEPSYGSATHPSTTPIIVVNRVESVSVDELDKTNTQKAADSQGGGEDMEKIIQEMLARDVELLNDVQNVTPPSAEDSTTAYTSTTTDTITSTASVEPPVAIDPVLAAMAREEPIVTTTSQPIVEAPIVTSTIPIPEEPFTTTPAPVAAETPSVTSVPFTTEPPPLPAAVPDPIVAPSTTPAATKQETYIAPDNILHSRTDNSNTAPTTVDPPSEGQPQQAVNKEEIVAKVEQGEGTILDKHGEGYCLYNSCQNQKSAENLPSETSTAQSWLKGLLRIVRSVPLFDNMEDSGLLACIVLPFPLVLFSFAVFKLCSGENYSAKLDSRYRHDFLNRIRELENLNARLRSDGENSRSAASAADQQRMSALCRENEQLKRDLQGNKERSTLLANERDSLQRQLEELTAKSAKQLGDLNAQLSQSKSQITVLELYEKERHKLQQQLADQESLVEKLKNGIERLEQSTKSDNDEKFRLSNRIVDLVNQLENAIKETTDIAAERERLLHEQEELLRLADRWSGKCDELEVELEAVKNSMPTASKASVIESPTRSTESEDHVAAESGDGSDREVGRQLEENVARSGSSTLSNSATDNETKKNKDDLFSLARMRVELTKVQKELEDSRVIVEKEKKGTSRLTEEINKKEAELDEKKRQLDEYKDFCRLYKAGELENKRIGAENRTLEQEIKQLTQKLSECQQEVLKLESAKRLLEETKKRLEEENRRCEQKVHNLEAKLFYLSKEKEQLEEKVNNLSNSSVDLNDSKANVLSSRISDSANVHGGKSVRPLWGNSDADDSSSGIIGIPSSQPLFRNHTTSPEELDVSDATGSMQGALSRTRSRRSQRGLDAVPGVPKRSSAKEGISTRRRSRSHGRQPDPYRQMSMLPPYGFLQSSRPLSTSGHALNTSAVSSGMRSPPEMPLISGVPPAGLVQRPTATNRKPPSQRH
ncbi:hypothetical protein QR680_017552 [Steinernema hermaphroditum]|uniref:SH3 domain-containing protein n=1 Tax=Steinernema hermaphroditum TaxID=289476 RepID=A0AA39HFY9_9BILA|nr:hypothetical protein QR680_017552 [Steinernema hermaphroditum]